MIEKIKNKLYNLLRWSEKYTHTDMVYLSKGGFWLTLSQSISAVSSFLLAIAFANLLPKENYGTYKYILSILPIVALTALPGMNIAITQSIAKGHEGSLVPAFKNKLKWSSLGSSAALLMALYYFYQNSSTLAIAFLLICIFVPFSESFLLFSSLLSGKKLFRIASQFSIISQLLLTLSIFITILLTDSIIYIIFVYLFINTLLHYIFFKISKRKYLKNDIKDKEAVSFGKHLSVISIFSTIASQIDSILLWHYLGASSVAIYSFALAPITPVSTFIKSIFSLAIPKFVNQDKENLKKSLFPKVIKSFFLLTIPVLILILIIPPVFHTFFSKYAESIKYAQLLTITLLFFPDKLLGMAITSRQNKNLVYKISLFNASIKIILTLVLLPIYGIWGAIIANITQHIIAMLVSVYFFKRM